MGGVDKATIVVAGRSLLERSLSAVESASVTIVVGPVRETSRSVLWARESPPGGGPVAAIAAGLTHVVSDSVAIVAVDLPLLSSQIIEELDAAGAGLEGAICVDEQGRDQPLAGVYRSLALRRALANIEPHGASVASLVRRLNLARVDIPEAARDCDTGADIASIELMLAREVG